MRLPFVRGLFASLAIALASPVLAPVHAQGKASITEEMAMLADWMEEFRPVTSGLLDVLNPVDEADLALASFVEGDIDQTMARARVFAAKEDVLAIGEALRADVAALPPFPQMTYINNPRLEANVGEIETMLDSLENTAISLIDTYAAALDGDEEATDKLAELGFDRAKASIEVMNQITAADIASIADEQHPQKAVLSSAYVNNEIVILFLGIEKGRQNDYSEQAEVDALREVDRKIAEAREIIRDGKTGQANLISRFQTMKLLAAASDKGAVESVLAMLRAYDQAWPVEAEMAMIWEELAASYRSISPAYDTSMVYTDAFDRLTPLEDKRQQLIFDRVALMKQ